MTPSGKPPTRIPDTKKPPPLPQGARPLSPDIPVEAAPSSPRTPPALPDTKSNVGSPTQDALPAKLKPADLTALWKAELGTSVTLSKTFPANPPIVRVDNRTVDSADPLIQVSTEDASSRVLAVARYPSQLTADAEGRYNYTISLREK